MDERKVDVGGLQIHHREVGEGPPLLMLHGFPQTGHCWRAVADRLSGRFRVLTPDVPGFGASGAPPIHDAETVSRIMFEYLDAVDGRDAIVAGHDWGGAFALRMALDRPERVPKLVLTNTAFRELSPLHSWYIALLNVPVLPELAFRYAGDKILSGAFRGATAAGGRSVFEGEPLRIYQEAYSDPERVGSALAYYRTVTRRAVTKQVRARISGGVLRTDVPEKGARRGIEMPTLIVWGMKDPALPPRLLRGMKRDIPQAEIVELDDVGHFVPEEAPDELATAIDRFAG